MGILDKIKGQLIDVIEWTDSSSKTMVHKYNMNGKEIMMGAQLTVRESQVAIFVNEGETVIYHLSRDPQGKKGTVSDALQRAATSA